MQRRSIDSSSESAHTHDSEHKIDKELKALKKELISMAEWVEASINEIASAVADRDLSKMNRIQQTEDTINQLHKHIDAECVRILALQQPLAVDLRFIVSVIKINTDLERMGNQAVSIARRTSDYLNRHPFNSGNPEHQMLDVPEMFSEVAFMVREALDAFVKGSEELARDVLKRDDRVDGLKNKVFRDVVNALKKDPESLEQGLSLILIARNLERIGDHATNVSEDVIFAESGEDIRHQG